MGRLRSASKLALALLMSLCALVFLALIVTRVEQHFFRQRAVLLLSQVQSIELRKTSWQEAQTQFQRWGADRKLDEHCDLHKCSVQITLNDPVLGYLSERNLFVKLDDYFRWRLKLSYDTGHSSARSFGCFAYTCERVATPQELSPTLGCEMTSSGAKGFRSQSRRTLTPTHGQVSSP